MWIYILHVWMFNSVIYLCCVEPSFNVKDSYYCFFFLQREKKCVRISPAVTHKHNISLSHTQYVSRILLVLMLSLPLIFFVAVFFTGPETVEFSSVQADLFIHHCRSYWRFLFNFFSSFLFRYLPACNAMQCFDSFPLVF